MSELATSLIGATRLRIGRAVKRCWRVAAVPLFGCVTVAGLIHGATELIDNANDRPIFVSHNWGS